MLNTPVDAPFSDQEWIDFLQTNDFGQLISIGSEDLRLLVTPTHFTFDSGQVIEMHFHRNNPILKALSERKQATLAVVGAHVFIPTNWNGDTNSDPAWSAPTSYYAAVQVRGEAEVVSRPDDLAALINRQMEHFQPEGGYHRVVADSSPFGKMLFAIKGVRMTIESVDAKFKFGGNRTSAHRQRVARRLSERGGVLDQVAMQETLRRDRLHLAESS